MICVMCILSSILFRMRNKRGCTVFGGNSMLPPDMSTGYSDGHPFFLFVHFSRREVDLVPTSLEFWGSAISVHGFLVFPRDSGVFLAFLVFCLGRRVFFLFHSGKKVHRQRKEISLVSEISFLGWVFLCLSTERSVSL